MSNLKKNIFYNFGYQFLILFIPLVTAPYLSRVVGATGVGLYSFSYSTALYFTLLTMLGVNNYGNREIASVKDDKLKRSKTFLEIYVLQVLVFILSISIYTIYTLNFAIDQKAAFIQGIFVISAIFDINWFFFGMEEFKITVIRNTIVKLFTLLCIFIFVKNSDDIYIYIAIMAIGYFVSQVSIWPFLQKYIVFTKISWQGVIQHLKPNLILFIPVVSVSIYKIMDKIILGYISSVEELGYFDSAEKIINVPIALITAIGTVMMPRMTSLIANKQIEDSKKYIDKTMFLMLAFATGSMAGIMAIAQEFAVIYYGGDFERAGTIMSYLSITILILACGNVIRTQYLIPAKKDKIFVLSAIIGAICNLVCNLILIPKYGAVGAAVSTVIAEFVVCFYQLYNVREKFSYLTYLKHEVYFLIAGILMYGTIYYLPESANSIFNIISSILIGILMYLSAVILYIFRIKKWKITKFYREMK